MKLKVLVDNNTYIDQYYCGEPAASYYIEDGEDKILFDLGYSDLFMKNLNKFGIDIAEINTIAISHGHDDHTGGLKSYFNQNLSNKISLIAHPHTFYEKKIDELQICSPILKEDLEKKCNLILSKAPIKISKNIIFLGEIPQTNNFETRKIIGKQTVDNISSDDYVMDDTAIVYQSPNGIYIVTGCSHSGICNIVEYAKKVTNDSRVLGIIGGFHLFDVNEQVTQTIEYLKNNKLKNIYPCHCTSFSVKAEIHKSILVEEVGVGLELEWE